jgi:hypothetical protein
MTSTNTTVNVEISLPALPEGYEYTGEYRKPKAGEHFLTYQEKIDQAGFDFATNSYAIVRRVPKVTAFKVTWEFRCAKTDEVWQFANPETSGIRTTHGHSTYVPVYVLTSTPILDAD